MEMPENSLSSRNSGKLDAMFSGLKIVAKGANSNGIEDSMPGFQGPNLASDWEALSTNF